ncbi:MAG TPA: DNA polymerase III subunit delta [Sporichthyaceae bacterium]|jgi:DNA polymerase-3 subunit delta|nr:DNA polymerase III subunit delta [Sporichthyaceae bacterium]
MSAASAAVPAAVPAVTLVIGPEELLVDRAVAAAARMIRAVDAEADVIQVAAGVLESGAVFELTAASLFAQRRLLVIRGAQDLTGPALVEIEALLADLPEDTSVVLTHAGGAKGKGVLEAARRAGAVVVDCAEVKKTGDKLTFVSGEFRAASRRISSDAAKALLDAVGGDLRGLAGACAQLVADTTGTVEVDTVRRYYAGRAEVTSFAVADLAVEGRTEEALVQLRWALSCGVEPVLVVAALAMALRNIAKLAGAPRGARPADLARDLGMPPWKIDRVRAQLRGWDGEGIARALRAVATADADVKGAAASPGYALERALVTVGAARRR